jgi:hypothetical protein
MIVEPYDFKFPFQLTASKLTLAESNYVSNAEDSRENRQSAFAFNRKGDTRR